MNYPKIPDIKPTNPTSNGTEEKHGNKAHRLYRDGIKIAHAINSQSLSHLLIINNALSST